MIKIFQIFQQAEKWAEGLNFLEECYQNYPQVFIDSANPYIKYYEFLFLEYNDCYDKATKVLEKLVKQCDEGDTGYDLASNVIGIRISTD